jgi:hypothetical protein
MLHIFSISLSLSVMQQVNAQQISHYETSNLNSKYKLHK